MFYASWKAFYVQLVSTLPTRKANEPFANFLDKEDAAMGCKSTLAASPNCSAVIASSVSKTAKIIHHFRVDAKTPLDPTRSGEAWALIGHGALSFPLELSARFWNGCEGVTLTFEDMRAMTTHEEFDALSVATTQELQEDENLKFTGKRMVVLPPFLTKAMMDADTEDAILLMMAACKALCDFDTMADGAFVPNGSDPAEGLMSAREEFFHVVQFLFLVGRDTLKGATVNILTTARAEAWATSVAMDCGVRMAPPQETTGASNQDVRNLTSGVHQLTAAVSKSNDAVEARAESTKTKSGKDKMQSFVTCMIFNASEEIDKDTVDDNGNPVPSRTDFVDSYKTILECLTAGSTKQQLDYYLNHEKMC